MIVAAAPPVPAPAVGGDQAIVLRAVPWEVYEGLAAARGESATPRLTYLDGALELMAPSRNHEILKTKLARLVEAYAEATGRPLEGYGSWTLRSEAKAAGLEPDECYAASPLEDDAGVPDLAIEVVWTRGAIDKLDVYRRLGVREVWTWEDGRLAIHLRGTYGYRDAERSLLFPDLDPRLIEETMREASQTAAVRELRRRVAAAS